MPLWLTFKVSSCMCRWTLYYQIRREFQVINTLFWQIVEVADRWVAAELQYKMGYRVQCFTPLHAHYSLDMHSSSCVKCIRGFCFRFILLILLLYDYYFESLEIKYLLFMMLMKWQISLSIIMSVFVFINQDWQNNYLAC